jgi:hypothetical protein
LFSPPLCCYAPLHAAAQQAPRPLASAAPVVLGLLQLRPVAFFGVPTFVEVDAKNPEVLFGIVPETTRKFFVEVNGFLYSSENRQILLSIVGFYFGTSAAARKS